MKKLAPEESTRRVLARSLAEELARVYGGNDTGPTSVATGEPGDRDITNLKADNDGPLLE